MCLKCKEEVTNLLAQVNLIHDDFAIAFEFPFLLSNQKGSLWHSRIVPSFLKKI
jgi:hypothetical protein